MAIIPGLGPKGNLPKSMVNPTKAADRALRFRFYRGAFKYAFLPEFAPRIKRMGKNLGHFAHLLALVFRSVRLLPANHPMLSPANIGKFGFVDVITAAANNLVVDKKHADQILIFGAILLAVIMIIIQMGIIAFFAALGPTTAHAQDGMFTTPDKDNDVVLTFLQQTIGLDGFFNGSKQIGFSIASGIREMLRFYSTGLMIIATIIVVYYVITVVAEAARDGTPFGRRFNSIWAPIRLVIALGMLVPLGNGLNAAQYTALSVARAGSGFATQAWIRFVDAVAKPDNVTTPILPLGLTTVGKQIFMMQVCAAAYNIQQTGDAPQVGFVVHKPL
ncbi:MAG: DotA/TraY family protein, partial [Alphaproteobacteria bacterium]|nr:DotA/TraY family protein [Alphaproteobacteria bacterium]